MFFDLKSYLVGKHGGAYTPSADLPSYLMGRAKSGGIQEITGTLPLAVRSLASQALKNYIVYGESIQDGTPTPDNPVEVTGLGVRTVNLFDKGSVSDFGYYLNANGTITIETSPKTSWISAYISVKEGENYSLTKTGSARGKFYKDDFTPYQTTSFDFSSVSRGVTFSIPATVKYVRFTINVSQGLNNIMLVEGSTLPDAFVPYGYKLPITVTANGTTTDYPLYIGDSQLMEGEYVDYEEQKIYKLVDGVLTPTDPPEHFPDITIPEGEVTIDIDGELKPQATIKGLISSTT